MLKPVNFDGKFEADCLFSHEKMRHILSLGLLILLFQACAPNPQKSQQHLEEGIQLLYKSKFKNAVHELNKAIEFNNTSHEAYFYRASAYFNLKDVEKAKLDYQKAIELKPDYADACFNLGRIYDFEKNYDMACYYYRLAYESGKPNIGDYIRRCMER